MGEKQRLALSVVEAAELLGLAPKTVYQLIHIPGFPCFKVGAKYVVSRKGLETWVEQQAAAGMAAGQ